VLRAPAVENLGWRCNLQRDLLVLIADRLSGQIALCSQEEASLSQEYHDRPIDNVDVAATWQALESHVRSQLIDVRTRAEWTYVGIPDLGSLSKRAVLVEWQTFPDQTIDPRFVERLARELSALGVKLDDDLFFICRSGGRSLAAAKAMAAMGYRACHNVTGGFEGPLDDERHRGIAGGWKAAGLPWQQG
jgi:rhodanese-related sulfurtransferase